MKLFQSNGAAVFTVLVLIVIVFISFYVMMKPFSMVFTQLSTNSSVAQYTNPVDCATYRGFWYDSKCNYVPERTFSVMKNIRYMWLLAPIIFVIGLFIWLVTMALKRDYGAYLR